MLRACLNCHAQFHANRSNHIFCHPSCRYEYYNDHVRKVISEMKAKLKIKPRRKLKHNEYRCAMCKEVYAKGWSDEEAMAEAQRDFPHIPIEETKLICEDCYELITTDMRDNPSKYEAN